MTTPIQSGIHLAKRARYVVLFSVIATACGGGGGGSKTDTVSAETSTLSSIEAQHLCNVSSTNYATEDEIKADLVEDAAELALSEDEDLHVAIGLDRRVAGSPVEQCQLAEVVARAERGDLAAVPGDRRVALEDEEELVPGLTLLHDRLARAHPHLVGRPADGRQLLPGAGPEEPDLRQVIELAVLACHRAET